MPRTDVDIRMLMAATDIDVLPDTSIVEDRGAYVVVRTPTNPTYHWGNFLHWRLPPAPGDRARWEAAFLREFGTDRPSQHCAFSWDVPGVEGVARSEFIDQAGYESDHAVALVAEPHELRAHARASEAVSITVLDPDGDAGLWDTTVELQVAAREPGHTAAEYRTFVAARNEDRRSRFRAGDGAWLIARLPSGEVVGSCGVVVTERRARFQAVDTGDAHRRRGIATRLVHEAGRLAIDRFGAEHLVIVADVDYFALPLYLSLGFVERERCLAVCWWPGAEHAAKHPVFGHLARSGT
jgi:GNAT superfamily N-acetyltransferase